MTKLVESNMKATASTNRAPLSTRAQAVDRAAKEQDEEMAPNADLLWVIDQRRLENSTPTIYYCL
jgi:hypothetical protein